ncbi:uncharacterized protein LOC128276952, partial [Anopheles cruzii]|uniref:uncharacterized protein LOC128276952 n=1 Tax=Anopheles cruzii TaxID=68878 RepID=UPI0022EC8AC0
MGLETLVVAALVSLLGVAPGIEGSYQENTNHGNVLHHVLKVVRPADASEHFQASPEVFQRHQQPLEYYQPEQPQDQLFQHVAKQQYVVQSGHNIASHQATDQQQQRQTALPYNNQRLHVNVDGYQRVPHSQAHPLPI